MMVALGQNSPARIRNFEMLHDCTQEILKINILLFTIGTGYASQTSRAHGNVIILLNSPFYIYRSSFFVFVICRIQKSYFV